MAIRRSAVAAAIIAGAPFGGRPASEVQEGDDSRAACEQESESRSTTVQKDGSSTVSRMARVALCFGVWCLDSLGSFAALDVLAVSVIVIVSRE